MAAGLGFKTFTTGEVLTAADVNGYLMQGILVFANAAARSSAITSPQEGQYSFLKDTNALEYYDGAAWVGAPVGDITSVTAGTGISGGGSSGAVTITNDMATTITAAGDIVVGTGSGTYDNLPIGTTGQVLTADTTVSPYKVKWAAASAGGINPNAVVNGGFDIWQRGTSFTALSKTFTADRWWKFRGGDATGGTWSRQNSAVSAPGTQYCMRIQRDSGNTSTATMQLYSDFETSNSIIYAGQEITVSFYARKGANYSGGDFNLTLQTGTGTDQSQFSGFTNETTVLTVTATAASMNTSTFVRYSGTVTLASTVTQLGLKAIWTPTGTAGAADFVEITAIKLEEGSSATDFIRSGGTLAGELVACQRYYCKTYNIDVAPGTSTENGIYYFSQGTDGQGNALATIDFPVVMRTAPTVTTYTGTGTSGNWKYARSGVSPTDTTTTVDPIGTRQARVYGTTGGNWVVCTFSGHFVASAEL